MDTKTSFKQKSASPERKTDQKTQVGSGRYSQKRIDADRLYFRKMAKAINEVAAQNGEPEVEFI